MGVTPRLAVSHANYSTFPLVTREHIANGVTILSAKLRRTNSRSRGMPEPKGLALRGLPPLPVVAHLVTREHDLLVLAVLLRLLRPAVPAAAVRTAAALRAQMAHAPLAAATVVDAERTRATK